MTCPRCQMANPPGTPVCESCGFALRGARGSGGESKGLAIASLVLGIVSLCSCAGLGVGAVLGTILGIMAMVKANNSPATHGGKGLAIAGTVLSVVSIVTLVPLVPMLMAIVIPSLLRARVSANESATIGDIRTVISAEAAYQSSNGGFYDNLECMNVPTRCIPGYRANAPTFIDTDLTQAQKSGYKRSFHPGPAADATTRSTRYSPSSITAYAYVAEPIQLNQTGVRAFCGDSTGVVCQTPDGHMPPLVDDHCPSECQPLY